MHQLISLVHCIIYQYSYEIQRINTIIENDIQWIAKLIIIKHIDSVDMWKHSKSGYVFIYFDIRIWGGHWLQTVGIIFDR